MCSVAQLYPTLCDPMECSPPGSSVRGDSPGKNTGVDCHALLSFWSAWDQISFVSHFSCVRFCATLWTARLLCPWDSPGTNTGVGCHFLFQGIVRTQGLNPGVLNCRRVLYHLSHQGSPYFVLPPFKENGLPFWVPGVLCHHSEVVLWNLLSVQMIFR